MSAFLTLSNFTQPLDFTSDQRSRTATSCSNVLNAFWVFLWIIVGFEIAAIGAKSTSAFRLISFIAHDPRAQVDAIAIAPRSGAPAGIVLCIGLPDHDEGRALRHVAEQNLIAVAWRNEPAAIHRQESLDQLRALTASRPWARGLPIGTLLIAPVMPSLRVDRFGLLIQINDEWRFDRSSLTGMASLHASTAIRRDDDDQLEITTGNNHATINCRNTDIYQRLAITRIAAEMFAARWGAASPASANSSGDVGRLALGWLSAGVAATVAGWLVVSRRCARFLFVQTGPITRGRSVSIGFAFAALMVVIILLSTELLSSWQRQPSLSDIASQNVTTVEADQAMIQEALSFSRLQYLRYYPRFDTEIFHDYVLSPIVGSSLDTDWRRVLWRAVYPHVRSTRDPEEAAKTVVNFLRSRITICAVPDRNSLTSCWRSGRADAAGFDRVYVASLRSIGIAARIDADGHPQIYMTDRWRMAPRALFTCPPKL